MLLAILLPLVTYHEHSSISLCIGSNTAHGQEALGGNTRQVTWKLTLLPLSKASTDCITFYRISLCNHSLMQWLCIYV
jgi:hypothetical protein